MHAEHTQVLCTKPCSNLCKPLTCPMRACGQDITYPSVTMVDRDSRQSLCTYRLEDQPQHVLATHSSVIMCRLFPSMLASLSSKCCATQIPLTFITAVPRTSLLFQALAAAVCCQSTAGGKALPFVNISLSISQ